MFALFLLAASSSAGAAWSASPGFQLIIDPPTQQLPPGDSVSFVVGIGATDGFSEPVLLSVSELPEGVTGAFSVNPILPSGTSVLTLTAAPDAPTGSFSFTVAGTGGGITAVASRQVTVNFGLIPLCYGAVEGTVTDADTGLPLPGVDVGVGPGTTTDAAGHYRVEGLGLGQNNSPSEHFLLAKKAPDYWYFFKFFFAVCDQTTRLDFTLVPVTPARVSGRVLEGDPDPANFDTVVPTSTPIGGAKVVVPLEPHQNRPVGASPDPDTTAADGLYDIAFPLGYNNEPLNREVCAYTEGDPSSPAPWREGFWPRCISLGQLEGDQHVVHEVGLVEKCTGSISGQVLDADTGLPVAGALVTATEPQPYLYIVLGGSVQVQADAEGRFSFPELLLGNNNRPRDVSVGADHLGYVSGGTGYTTTRLESCGDHREVTLYPQPVEPPKSGAIEGHVFDEETGAPVEGVEVSLLGGCPCDTTDADGYYQLAPVNLGTFDELTALVFTRHSEYWDDFASAQVHAGQTATLDIRILRYHFARITGVVRDAITKTPIANASVNDGFVGAFTDEDGRYALEDVPLGHRNAPRDATVRVSADGYWARALPVPVRADETSTQDFELVPICEDATIVGKVVNAQTPTQEPIPDALVGGGGAQARTDANGDYRLEHVKVGVDNAPNKVDVTASHLDFYTQTKQITVFCGAVITVDFGRPPSSAAVEGYVTNVTTNTPIAGVFVGSEFGAAAQTDANGYYRLPNAPLNADGSDRTWKITSAPDGFEAQTKPVTVHANTTARLDFGFGNPPAPGTIVVRKHTLPSGSSQSFAFTTSYGPGFSISDGQSNTSVLLAAGSYSVSETAVSGWDASASCSDGSEPSNIDLSGGETVTCTFTNTKRATIIIEKVMIGATSTFTFSGTPSGAVSANNATIEAVVQPGRYQSTEAASTGWDLTSIVCDDPNSTGNVGTATASFNADPGETITCTFTNTKRGSATVLKTTNGVVDPAKDITFVLSGQSLPTGGLTRTTSGDLDGLLEWPNLAPSQYRVCEKPVPAGFTSFWKLDGVIVTPYNPDASRIPPEDLGTRCYDFSVSAGQRRAFEVNNSRPGGDPRTIGYWKNWNRCTGGNQSATAAKNGGAAEGFFLVEDLLPQIIGDFSLTSCQQAVKLLAKQDQSGRSKSSDAAYELGAQLLAARFNLAAGAETCSAVQQVVLNAQTLLDGLNFTGSGDYLGSKSKDARRPQALSLAATLDRYNNGNLC